MGPNLSKGGGSGIRTFVAIELSDQARATLASIEDRFRVHAGVLKLVAPELLHLTVRFLGSVAQDRIAQVEEAARVAATDVPSFHLHLASVRSFGGAAPRVVWVGLRHDAGMDRLQRLHARLEDALHSRGFERERRPLSAHLTLARVRDGATRTQAGAVGDLVAELAAGPELSGSFEVGNLTIMRSDLSPRGPRYTPLAHAPLGRLEEVSR